MRPPRLRAPFCQKISFFSAKGRSPSQYHMPPHLFCPVLLMQLTKHSHVCSGLPDFQTSSGTALLSSVWKQLHFWSLWNSWHCSIILLECLRITPSYNKTLLGSKQPVSGIFLCHYYPSSSPWQILVGSAPILVSQFWLKFCFRKRPTTQHWSETD